MPYIAAAWSLATLLLLLAAPLACGQATDALETLKLGDTAPDFELVSLQDEKIKLSQLTKKGAIVLVVLRGFPGYQCPICSRQVTDLRFRADQFRELRSQIVLVYPGPAEGLKDKAQEFLRGVTLPEPFTMVIDPDYGFTNLFKLRWDAPRETAYPSTFVLNNDHVVKYRKVSTTHGDRAPVEEILAALASLQNDSSAPAGATSTGEGNR